MIANNMGKLRSLLLEEIRKAMYEIKTESANIVKEEIQDFYNSGQPIQYTRTYAMKRTPRTSGLTNQASSVGFKIWLDTSYRYETGKRPTMTDVLNLTNDGTTSSSVGRLFHTVGKGHYWNRSEKKIEKALNTTMKRYFR